MRDNLTAAITATAQAIPAMATQGQDPSVLIRNIADVIQRRSNGDSIENAAMAVFTPPAAPEQPAQQEMVPPGLPAPVEQAPPSPAAPGPAAGGNAPQVPQDLQGLLAGLGA